MTAVELAERLANADSAERAALLSGCALTAPRQLADALRGCYLRASTSDPSTAQAVAGALAVFAAHVDDGYVSGVALWIGGLAELQLHGRIDAAIDALERAAHTLAGCGEPYTAALTRVGAIYALAMAGRYDEAIATGLDARRALVAHGDEAAAGRVEHNLGNIYFRRDEYAEAEQYYREAYDRFTRLRDETQLALVGNCLANALNLQHRFQEAGELYEEALGRAAVAGLEVTGAEIERNIGCLDLAGGRYNEALDYLERARRRYAALGLHHKTAGVEYELAAAYLELNLAPEAAELFQRAINTFAELGMRAEEARARQQCARAYVVTGRLEDASASLSSARALYAAESNALGEAEVTLTEAQVAFFAGEYRGAAVQARVAEALLVRRHTWRAALLARWLRGEAARRLGRARSASRLLQATLRDADRHTVPQIKPPCLTSLGLVAASSGEPETAEAAFGAAIELVEDLRSPLPSEEFRSAYAADKLQPYFEMVRLCLAAPAGDRIAEGLQFAERARARTLAEAAAGYVERPPHARDEADSDLLRRLTRARAELNALYGQLHDTQVGRESPNSDPRSLHAAVQKREATVLEVSRLLAQRTGRGVERVVPQAIERLQRHLSTDAALVEYFSIDDELLAFVVTERGVEVVRELGSQTTIDEAVRRMRFQIASMSHGADAMQPHIEQLTRRVQHHLRAAYDALLRPIEGLLGDRRLVVVPHRGLHYLPFQALFDGEKYVVERRDVSTAPSADLLLHCLDAARRPIESALLLGVPDERIPHVRNEVRSLQRLFPRAVGLLDGEASIAALRTRAPEADVLHLACHGRFRSDSPLFSALRLADGWLTVRDAYDLALSCQIATLSACETGVSAVAPGDELFGLARGFLVAGAPSLLVSLWTVDDASTAELMRSFYARLVAGDLPAAALRYAQRRLMVRHPHPFYWAPFVLMGRW